VGGVLVSIVFSILSLFYFYRWNLMDLLSSLSSRGQPNWLQATVSTILQNLIQTVFKIPREVGAYSGIQECCKRLELLFLL